MACLVRVPLDVLHYNVFALLEIKDLVKLESACANKALHLQLKECLQGWYSLDQLQSINSNAVKWILKMEIAVKDATFHNSVTDENIFSIRNLLKKLQTLSFCLNTRKQLSVLQYNIGNEAIRTIANHCTMLKSLNISGCDVISDEGIAEAVRKCHALENLYMSITDLGVKTVVEACTNLQWLDISGNNQLHECGFSAVALNCKSLTTYECCHCAGVTDASIVSLAEQCNTNTNHRRGCAVCCCPLRQSQIH